MAVVLLALFITALNGTAEGKVAPTSLSNLTTVADQIVTGTVVAVNSVEGIQVATLEVDSTLKGPSFGHLYFLAQPTWVCDTSEAKLGEHVLLFLNKYTFGSGDKDLFDFKEPRSFKRKMAGLTGSDPFFSISWSGRGRMPVRTVDGVEYATLWTGDVLLPTVLATIDGPEKEYSSFIRSVPLHDLVATVKTQLEQARSQAAARAH